jgi:hypothetical protein
MLGNLARVDKKKIVSSHIDRIALFLSDSSIVLQGHSVRPLSKIAEANPDEAPKILEELLQSKKYFPENRIGFMIEEMGHFLQYEDRKKVIRTFVEPYLESNIKSVSRKARKIHKKI